MVAAPRSDGTKRLFAPKSLLHKIDDRLGILRDQIRRDHAIAAWNRTYRRRALRRKLSAFGSGRHTLHAAVHLLDRHLLFHCEHAPRIAKGILEHRIAVPVELV